MNYLITFNIARLQLNRTDSLGQPVSPETLAASFSMLMKYLAYYLSFSRLFLSHSFVLNFLSSYILYVHITFLLLSSVVYITLIVAFVIHPPCYMFHISPSLSHTP